MIRILSITLALFCATINAQNTKNVPLELKTENFIYKDTLTGIILSQESTKVKLDAKQWKTWEIEEAVAHGTMVRKGQTIIKFKTKDFEEALSAKKRDTKIAILNYDKSFAVNEIKQNIYTLNRKRALLLFEISQKEEKLYLPKKRPNLLANLADGIKEYELSLEYQIVELQQLKKMYGEDKITEETEEIVLKRQKDYVERLKKSLQRKRNSVEDSLTLKIPVSDFDSAYKGETARLNDQIAQIDWNTSDKIKWHNDLKMAKAHQKVIEKYEELEKDKQFLEIKAPADGMVFYGSYSKGKWSNTFGGKLKTGTKILNGSTIMSIINPAEMKVEAIVPAALIKNIGTESTFALSGSFQKRPLQLIKCEKTPYNDSVVAIFNTDDSSELYQGQKTQVSVINKINNVLVLEDKFIHEDELKPWINYVYVQKNDSKIRQNIKKGISSNGKTVIIRGLKAGDSVLEK
ncbi:MAG: efflux RND transporter periplasmic adaptor subunit [Lentisphaeraceae bacterium]|nr:efflux RND transporter periplasmic adaptor subunit [Lentisphaeraceae bacterium]